MDDWTGKIKDLLESLFYIVGIIEMIKRLSSKPKKPKGKSKRRQ